MKRAQKISLLTKVLQSGISQINRQRLQQVRENAPQSLIIIDDLDFKSGQTMSDSDLVHFYNNGKEYRMSLGEAKHYGCRFGVGTLFILPAKHEVLETYP